MEHHIYISSSTSDPVAEKKIDLEGAGVTVRLSPTDIPRGLIGKFDEKSQRLFITFDYSDDEPPASETEEQPGVVIREGKYSGKVLGITITFHDKKKPVAGWDWQGRLKAAFASRRKGFRGIRTISKELNQAVAETVLSDDRIVTELSSAAAK